MNEGVSVEECRACLRKIDKQQCQELFREWHTPWAIPGALLADDLAKFADVEISEIDKHSKVICQKCYSRLADACLFVITVQRSNSLLKERGGSSLMETETTLWPKPILVNKSFNGNIENRVEIEIKQEVVSEDEYGSNYMDQDWNPEMEIKIEPEQIVAPVQSGIQVNGVYSLKESSEEALHKNCSIDFCEEEYLDSTIKQEPLSGDEQDAIPDVPLDCMLCMKEFHCITGLKAHVIAHHSYCSVKRKTDNLPSPVKNEAIKIFVCAKCRECFKTRTDLMVHETCHYEHVCYTCDAKFNTFRQLSRHGARCRPRHTRSPATTGGPSSRPTLLAQTTKTEGKLNEQSKNGPSTAQINNEKTQKLLESQTTVAEKEIEEMQIQSENGTFPLKIKVEPAQEPEVSSLKIIHIDRLTNFDTKKLTYEGENTNSEVDMPDTKEPSSSQSSTVRSLDSSEINKDNSDKIPKVYPGVKEKKANHLLTPQPLTSEICSEQLGLKNDSCIKQSDETDLCVKLSDQNDPCIKQPELENAPCVTEVEHKNDPCDEQLEDAPCMKLPELENDPCIEIPKLEDGPCVKQLEDAPCIKQPELENGPCIKEPAQNDASIKLPELKTDPCVKQAEQENAPCIIQQDQNDPCIKQPEPDSSSSNKENDGTSNPSEITISNADNINQNMKVHLAINPLREEDSMLSKTKMDIDDIEVKIISEISDDNTTQ